MRLIFILSLSVLFFFTSASAWACGKKHIGKHSHSSRSNKHHTKTEKKNVKFARHHKVERKVLLANLRHNRKRPTELPPKYLTLKESQEQSPLDSSVIKTTRAPSSEDDSYPAPEIMSHDNNIDPKVDF